MTDPITRIEAELTRRIAAHEPPPGWEQRVLAATVGKRQQAPARTRIRKAWLAVPALAAAAVIVLVIARPGAPPTLVVTTERAGTVRGDANDPAPGDVLRAVVTTTKPHRAVWVYRGTTELQLACPGAAGCRDRDGALALELPLRGPGTYQIVALTSDAPIPAPRGELNADVGSASRTGAEREVRTIEVR